jgi:hypothetical protein
MRSLSCEKVERMRNMILEFFSAKYFSSPGSWMDLFPNEQNFDLDKSRQRLKEHHKISNIPKFRCKML